MLPVTFHASIPDPLLHALLTALGEPPPLILLPSSFHSSTSTSASLLPDIIPFGLELHRALSPAVCPPSLLLPLQQSSLSQMHSSVFCPIRLPFLHCGHLAQSSLLRFAQPTFLLVAIPISLSPTPQVSSAQGPPPCCPPSLPWMVNPKLPPLIPGPLLAHCLLGLGPCPPCLTLLTLMPPSARRGLICSCFTPLPSCPPCPLRPVILTRGCVTPGQAYQHHYPGVLLCFPLGIFLISLCIEQSATHCSDVFMELSWGHCPQLLLG